MRLFALTVASFAMLTACSFFKSTECTIATNIAKPLAAAVASSLSCTGTDAINADVTAELAKLNLCAAAAPAATAKLKIKTEAVVDICGPIVDGLVSGLLTQVPAKYGCTGGAVTADVKAKLVAACNTAL